jgi:hypothetical protein
LGSCASKAFFRTRFSSPVESFVADRRATASASGRILSMPSPVFAETVRKAASRVKTNRRRTSSRRVFCATGSSARRSHLFATRMMLRRASSA